ncbi:MAG: ISNCY family transposase [Desulfobulbaceae bacterium]|nr:ISNCY family transposase [Desulfobulbaceae bacterium]
MRRKLNPQLNLFTTMARNKIAKELQLISQVLDATPKVLDLVYQDLVRSARPTTGREGMTAEQVLRCAILKQYRQLTYEELAFHLEDSSSFRGFSLLEMGQYPCASTLQGNIKALREETWEALNCEIIGYAKQEKIESGRKVRIDATAVETNIHHPTDSTLLVDGIRIITRWLAEGKKLSPTPHYQFSDHQRVAKKRLMTILNTKNEKVRRSAYKNLLLYAGMVREYALAAIPKLSAHQALEMADFFAGKVLAEKLARAVDILGKVIDQTDRRVFRGEQVPASEKVVSFFEEHTDIIVKKRRETEFGHKIFLTGGSSTLILDCLIARGNPADTELYAPMLQRQQSLYGRMPRQVSVDGGFASKANLAFAKEHHVTDAVFAKKRGLSVLDMAKSSWVYKSLRNFRAGIEAGISTLKRAFGLDRCTWKGWDGFGRYVWSSIVSYNLLVLARTKLTEA